ncbi:PREDICTED: monocarboxylate transporter 12-like, partial [Priapulus caudatus]|uniref:Monocarboxylate transporter 12-like n=1 Tax=Priapulus caudatus TaxID=37621 RepID=A0ABM1F1G3_PRICU
SAFGETGGEGSESPTAGGYRRTGGVRGARGDRLRSQHLRHALHIRHTDVGSGYGLAYVPGATMIGYYFDRRIYLASSVATLGGVGCGLMLVAPLIQSLVDEYSWRGAMLVHGAIALHLCVVAALLRPMDNSYTREDAGWAQLPGDAAAALRDRRVVIFCINNVAWVAGSYAAFTMMCEFAESTAIVAERRSAFLLVCVGAAFVVGRFLAGVLANHPRCDELWVYNLATLVLGVVIIIFPGIKSAVVLNATARKDDPR